jgi:hypothetical protein
MANVSAGDIYAAQLAAGFPPAAALTGTEIALAESGGNPRAQGDLSLQDTTWGPSYGLWQIRTLRAATGGGGDRDINRLSSGVAAQAAAEYQISGGGTNWAPWTTYRTGAYKRFASTAAAAAGASSSSPVAGDLPVSSSSGGGPFPTWGPGWLPWNLPSDIGNAAANQLSGTLGGIRQVVIEGVVGLAAIGLVVGGAYVLARPAVRRRTAEAEKLAGAIL